MSNMSYCRWENTSRDLADCVGTFEEWTDEGEPERLSSEFEIDGFKRCIKQARELIALVDDNKEIIEAIENQREGR